MPRNIEELWLMGTAIEELPSSFGNLSRLQELFLDGCDRLKRLPSSICKWKSLQKLSIGYCSKLNELPNDIGPLESLEILELERDPIRELPSSIIYLKNLWMINCRGCEELTLSGFEFFPDNLSSLILSESGITELPEFPDGCLSSLRSLDLSGTSLESIPASIINLSGLSYLDICNCKRLKCLPKLPLGSIEAYGCTSLEVLPSPSLRLRKHTFANFINCFKLDQNIFEDILEVALLNIKLLHMCRFFDGCKLTVHGGAKLCYPGNEIPKWFNFRSMGSFINVELPPNWYNHNFIGFGFALCIAATPLLDGIQSYTDTGEIYRVEMQYQF
ncbi:hypothetical protein LWI29_028353 [Acer saccharum]|uniref:C-JID domain-containing protein n=1 Tax=Acer saccharum TaxID=4024 RepID=A0AA39VJ86_ACESA|nr:hypothetical protein LWI29_028353 [Acer saccharum]